MPERHTFGRVAHHERFLTAEVHPATTDAVNGTPEPQPYTWRPGEAEREREVQARLAAIRARLAGGPP